MGSQSKEQGQSIKPSAPMSLGLPRSMVSLAEELKSHIRSLRIVCVILSALLGYSTYLNMNQISDLSVHIPPDLSNGATMKVGEIPTPNVFVYTSHLWLEFNTWMNNGTEDAFNNVTAYRDYFSPQFLAMMKKEYEGKRTRKELERQRRLTLMPGTGVEAMKRVVPVTKNSWVVYLDVIDEEFYLGERVKNAKIRYSLLVEKVETTVDRNPIGVRIVGFKEKPRLLREL
ncbi:TIGR03746 family integrating conjugative element protein [Vibrio parahaemolyticus]|nr:TIGR03746 family integrating conjugative element protein [Vibrio parahaemolyticus]